MEWVVVPQSPWVVLPRVGPLGFAYSRPDPTLSSRGGSICLASLGLSCTFGTWRLLLASKFSRQYSRSFLQRVVLLFHDKFLHPCPGLGRALCKVVRSLFRDPALKPCLKAATQTKGLASFIKCIMYVLIISPCW